MSHIRLEAEIDGTYEVINLPDDTSLKIERVSPVFDTSAGGDFSYQMQVCVDDNMHIFGSLMSLRGTFIHERLYHKKFQLFFDNVFISSGLIELDDELEIEQDEYDHRYFPISLVSGYKELSQRLKDMKANEMPVMDRIPVGAEIHSIDAQAFLMDSRLNKMVEAPVHMPVPPSVFSFSHYYPYSDSDTQVSAVNVSEPYPIKPFCNVMVATQAKAKNEDGNYEDINEYEVFDADRPNSGVCFYVLYFLECVFHYLSIYFDNSMLTANEDMCRLAFFSTKCEYDSVATPHVLKETINVNESQGISLAFDGVSFECVGDFLKNQQLNLQATIYNKYANGKNFPDEKVSTIIEDLQNAFGIRFVFDSSPQSCKAIFVRDIFYDADNYVSSCAYIMKAEETDLNISGIKLTYNGSEGDMAYKYNPLDDNSRVVSYENYSKLPNVSNNNHSTFYDSNTGNMFRIKVNQKATNVEELWPSLMEVGQFQDGCVGDVSSEEFTKSFSLSFRPVINNIIEYIDPNPNVATGLTSYTTKRNDRNSDGRTSAADSSTSGLLVPRSTQPVFIDVNLSEIQDKKLYYTVGPNFTNVRYAVCINYKARFGFSDDFLDRSKDYATDTTPDPQGAAKPVAQYVESPLNAYDAGYCLGIMRGFKESGNTDLVSPDYDGFSNAQWAQTPKGYAFTSDCIDLNGSVYDYNGSEPGGVSLNSRFSLKIVAEKKRQLFSSAAVEGTAYVASRNDAAHWISALFGDKVFEFRLIRLSDVDNSWSEEKKGRQPLASGFVVLSKRSDTTSWLINVALPFAPNGKSHVMSKSELEAHISTFSDGRAFSDPYDLIIKRDATEKDLADYLALTDVYNFYSDAKRFYLTGIKEQSASELYPINSVNAHRGLLHKFNIEYFNFLLRARLVTLELDMPLAEIVNTDLWSWHRYGEYIGLIKSMSYTLSNSSGVGSVSIVLYYI